MTIIVEAISMDPLEIRPSTSMSPAPDHVEIRMLGCFGVTIAGREVPADAWAGRRSLELVQLLALAPGRQLIRDRVIDALWPHLEAEAGAANMRKAAHYARRALDDPESIVLRGGRVSLFPARCVTADFEQFEARAAEALATGDTEGCAQAAASFGGELLPATLYEEWTEQPRRRLRSTYLDLLRTSGHWSKVVEQEPTDELAYRQLMREALDRGARPIAIRWYARLESVLMRELGVSPSEETQRLYDECIAGLESAAPGFVGRHVELGRITDVMRAGSETRTGCASVRGPAGIGKTTLCRELACRAQDDGWRVEWVDVAHVEHPYAPLVAVADRLLNADAGLAEALGDGTRAVLAAMRPDASTAPALHGPPTRHQVVGAVRRVLLGSGAGRPVLLIVDDADHAPEATLEVLEQLVLSGPPLLVVLTYRTETGRDVLARGTARLHRAGRLATIDLGPLAREEAESLVVQVAGPDLEPELLRRIVDLGEGHPFATVEIARSMDLGKPARLPPTVAAAIAERLVDLDPDVVAGLARMALVGGDLDTAVVVALTGDTEGAAHATLDRALDAGVLLVRHGRYRFRHDLIRQALADRMPPHQRLVVHREAAERLADLHAPPSVIAQHWLAGERPDEAVAWLLVAARQAMGLGAFGDALIHVTPLLVRDPRHHEAIRIRAEALDMLGDPMALAAYDAAIDTASEQDSHDLRAMKALAQIKQGDPPGGLRVLEGARPRSVQGRLCEALAYSGAAALGYGDPALGSAKAAESRRLALETGDAAAIVVASWAQAAAAHARGELRDSVRADLCDTKDLPHLAVRVFDGQLCVTQRFLYGSRPYHDVIAFADGLAAEAKRLGAARGHAFGVTLRGEAELLSGQLDAAAVHLAEGRRLHRAFGGATGEAFALQRLAELALHRGRQADAAALLDEALDLARESDVGFHLFDRIFGARIALATERGHALAAVEEGEGAVRGPLETCPGCRITFAVPAAIASARAGDLERAARYGKSVEWLANVVMRLPAWYAALEEVRAHIALAAGDRRGSAAGFTAAAAAFATAGHPLDEKRCVCLAGAAAA
jgi:DNA-binding SARP family transcriptional activator/tetratricopeptide (TPR) repeat protein